MNCARFARILADYHEGTLTAGERTAAEQHLEQCLSCRSLLEVAAGGVDMLPEKMREELVTSILARTSGGSVCHRVESSLWEFANGEQALEESRLIALHLDHCADCRATAADLALIQKVLPAMSEIDPGEMFTRAVVQATSGLRASRPDARIRFRGWWNHIVQRPRFALESAYGFTLMLVFASLLLPMPNLALQTIPSKTIYPSANYVKSIWAHARTPISHHAQKLASVAIASNRAVSGTVAGLAERSARASFSALKKSLRRISGWPRKEATNIVAFWNRLSSWISRSKS